MRIFFATDVHGSETCWRKFLNAAAHYKADVLILGGDMTGKALVPIIHDGGGNWHGTPLGVRVTRRGYSPFRPAPASLQKLSEDEGHWHGLFQEKMLETVEKWMRMADERLGGTGVRIFCCPGNDDQFEVDDIIATA